MSPDNARQINKIPAVCPRPKEMEVLCLGLSRTATMSMHTALKRLGYRPYHMMEIGDPDNIKERHVPCWRDGMLAKLYGIGKPYGKPELDKLLGRYSAVTDAPCVNFSDELLAAYPNAKVVLTKRDPDKWLESMEATYYKVLGWKSWQLLASVDSGFTGPYTELIRLILMDWSGGVWQSRAALREGFITHNDHIRTVVPEENLLEWEPKDGWEPLCKHLGKPVPDEPFPYINKGDGVVRTHTSIFWYRLVMILRGLLKWPAAVALAAMALWYLRSWGNV